MDIAGTPRPLAAAPDSRAPVFNNAKATLQRRYNPVTLDNQDPQAAVIQFWNTKGNFVQSSGFESKWLTVR